MDSEDDFMSDVSSDADMLGDDDSVSDQGECLVDVHSALSLQCDSVDASDKWSLC